MSFYCRLWICIKKKIIIKFLLKLKMKVLFTSLTLFNWLWCTQMKVNLILKKIIKIISKINLISKTKNNQNYNKNLFLFFSKRILLNFQQIKEFFFSKILSFLILKICIAFQEKIFKIHKINRIHKFLMRLLNVFPL